LALPKKFWPQPGPPGTKILAPPLPHGTRITQGDPRYSGTGVREIQYYSSYIPNVQSYGNPASDYLCI